MDPGQEEYCEPPVSPKPPTSPAFGLPHDQLTNQCKCRRRPGPQLAFQRSRTTSRALNKCRCDRRETQRGRLSARTALPTQASAHRRGPRRSSQGACGGYGEHVREERGAHLVTAGTVDAPEFEDIAGMV